MNTEVSHSGVDRSRRLPVRARLLLGAAAALLLAGCEILPKPTEDPTRYYVLTLPTDTSNAPASPARAVSMGLRSVELPGYLHNNRTIVVRNGVNEIHYEDFARWAEPLELGLGRILKERLLATNAVGGVVLYPFPRDERRDFDVTVHIVQCEGGAQSAAGLHSAKFSAVYEITKADGSSAGSIKKSFTAEDLSWDGKDFSRLVRLLSDDAAKLADDIVANLPK